MAKQQSAQREELQMDHQVWVEKANENLASAQLCFEQGHFNACSNRLYYAMFHAGLAALAKAGLSSMNKKISHDWLQANFSRQLIQQRKIFTAKFRSYLSDAQSIRDITDYKRFSVSQDSASRELKKAKEFVNMINQEVFHDAQS
ncbi:HEPN domain-containing protein [candidate division KSB1 bacterium]|nr:HEPN domain-containing protein [candidate division KSB1 bacterium]